MKIAIAGYGLEGKASYEYWHAQNHEVTIADERNELDGVPAGVRTILGSDAFSRLAEFDLIIRSPSINPKKLPYGEKVWSATNEFFAKCPAEIIGVTGTKGKGTTCSLITSILKAAGKTVHLVGNIGAPALAELSKIQPGDIVVYELSSFQLWDIKKSPYIAVVLPIEPDHLDIHDGWDDYIAAKTNIVRFQYSPDETVYYPNNEASESIGKKSQAILKPYMSPAGAYVQDGWFWFERTKLCPVDDLRLPGNHNIENACAAITAAAAFIKDEEIEFKAAVQQGLHEFDGLPHRLKFVAEKKGVKYYDDSIATTPSAAMAALKAFDVGKVLILGGKSKGGSYDELLKQCERSGVKVIAIGEIGRHIAELCSQYGVVCRFVDGLMDEVVAVADEMAMQGDVVLLSPAAASFDQYDNYAARGDQFIAAVERL